MVPAARDAQNAAGESELESLHDSGGSAALWLADQQMLGHHDIAQNHESVALSDLFSNGEKQIAPGSRAQPWLVVIATASDEVQVSGAVISVEILGHDGNARTKADLASVTDDP